MFADRLARFAPGFEPGAGAPYAGGAGTVETDDVDFDA